MTAFAEGYKIYKSSPKGPDNLLKLGITLAVLGRKADACADVRQVQPGLSTRHRPAEAPRRPGAPEERLRVSAADHQPLDAADFARLMAPFEPFERAPVLAVAVSGGRNSLALALLAQEWATARGGRIVGLIVDHGAARRSRPRKRRRPRLCWAPWLRCRDPALVRGQAAHRPAGSGARGALSAAARGLPPARHSPSAGRPSCR